MGERETNCMDTLEYCQNKMMKNAVADLYNAERTRRALARYNNPTDEIVAIPKADPKRIDEELAKRAGRGRRGQVEDFALKVLHSFDIKYLARKTGIPARKILALEQKIKERKW